MNKKRIKILFLIDEIDPGGTEHQLLLLADGLGREFFEPVIGVLRRSNYQEALNIKTPVVDFRWSGFPFFKNISLLLRLRNYIEREKFDILQTYLVDSTIYGVLGTCLSRHRPYLISTRRNLYHWVKEEPWSFFFLRQTVRFTDHILVNSYSAFKECQQREKVPLEKITLIPNAIETERFNGISKEEAKRKIGLGGGEYPVIGVVGNWRPIKGLFTFLEAAARVYYEIPTAVFVLVGEGPQENDLKDRVRDLKIQERIFFLKNCSDIPSTMAAFDVAVQSSHSESFSNVLLEYMASARPIVATRVGDAEMAIENGREGLLVHPNDPKTLSEAILTLCRDKNRASVMGRLGQEKVAANWSSDRILGIYEGFYQGVMELRNIG